MRRRPACVIDGTLLCPRRGGRLRAACPRRGARYAGNDGRARAPPPPFSRVHERKSRPACVRARRAGPNICMTGVREPYVYVYAGRAGTSAFFARPNGRGRARRWRDPWPRGGGTPPTTGATPRIRRPSARHAVLPILKYFNNISSSSVVLTDGIPSAPNNYGFFDISILVRGWLK